MMRLPKTALGMVALTTLWLLALPPAAAQFLTGFEPNDGYAGCPDGTVLTGQNDWYLPNNVSTDHFVFTYDGNALGLPANPLGEYQFIGAQALGNGKFPRAQLNFDWSFATQWTVEYDIVAHFNGTLPAHDNLGSFSLQPGGNFIALSTWADAAGATTWNAKYLVNDQSNAVSPGDEWTNLAVDNWYHQSTTFDLSSNLILSVSITDLTTGTTATANPDGWHLLPSPRPTALRLFVGGGGGEFSGNVMGFDNLSITPGP